MNSERAADRPRQAWKALAALTALLLAACGGGGGDGGGTTVQEPPASAATLGGDTATATDAVRSTIASADAAIGRNGTLLGLNTLFGQPGTAAATTATAPKRRAMRTETSPCTDLLDPPCSGSVTLETDIPDTASVIDAGRHIDARFNALSGSLFGERVSMYGRMRFDFLTRLDPFAASWDGLRLVITLDGFGGSLAGTAFGPVSDMARLEIGNGEIETLIVGGRAYTDLQNVTATDANNYRIGGGTVRGAFGSDSTRYVDTTFTGWSVGAGRPTVGSRAIVAAANGSIEVVVQQSSAQTVVYGVSMVVMAAQFGYVVTATYPAGGGAPTYAAVPAV